MPQEFQVLRCYQCSTFQVHQVKKAKKWSCKMCGEKQSVIKVFGRGTAADCRHHVQKLNSLRGEIEQVTLETSTEPSTFGEQSVEISHTSHTQIGKDNTQSVDRWSMFVTSEQEEEDVAEDDQYDDRFTTDMAEFRQKQMTRKRKRNQKHGDYEDESSEELHYNFGRNQSHARRRPSWKDCTPEGSYINGGQKDDVDQSETNHVIILQGNRSYLKGQYQSSSVNSAQDYNRGQRHRSRFDGYENVVDRYSCYNEDQKDDLLECQSGRSAGTSHSSYQDIKKTHVLNTGQGHHQVLTEGQSQNRGQGHCHAQNDDQSLERGEGHYQVLTETQSLNKGQGHHQVLSKGQSVKGQGHHGGMKKNQSGSKWSKYEDSSDSGEENCMTTEQPEMSNLSEKHKIDLNMDNKISAGNDSYVQSRQERIGENTSTVLDYSVDVGNPKDLLYNTDSLTEKVISPDRRQKQHKMWTGGFSGESKSVAMEGNNNQLKGDNSNRLIGPEEKLVNTSTESQGEDIYSIRKDQDSKYVKHHQPVTGYSGGTLNSYFTEDRLIVEPRSVSTLTKCNQMRSNVSSSERRNSNSGHTRPLTQKSTPLLQPLFVTEDITDEDLAL